MGTLTFYEPESNMFCALGHGITDVDTQQIIKLAKGELVTTNIIAITKGKKGTPGELKGSIEYGESLGNVYKNSALGIYGNLTNINKLNVGNPIDVALRNEVKEGEAEIICELENGKKENYKIKIEKLFTSNNSDNKSMIIKITDERLLEKTGGIIQGMSGSPIIQDGKFVGAVTHVLVNNPEMGYGVFADMLIKEMKDSDK